MTIDLDRLETAILGLIVVRPLLRLRYDTKHELVPIVVRSIHAIVACPLRRARRCLITHNQERLISCQPRPPLRTAPLDLLRCDIRKDQRTLALVNRDEERCELRKRLDVPQKLVDRLILLLLSTTATSLRIRETKNENIATAVNCHRGQHLRNNLLALRTQRIRIICLDKEGLGLVNKTLTQKAVWTTETSRRRVIKPQTLINHLLKHRIVIIVINLTRVENLLRSSTVENERNMLILVPLAPELAQNLALTRSVITLIQMKNDMLALRNHVADPDAAAHNLTLIKAAPDLDAIGLEFIALVLISSTVPRRYEAVNTLLRDRTVPLRNILHHLPLA